MNIRSRLKPLFRDFFSYFLSTTGLLSRRLDNKDKLTIITFHRVLPDSQRNQYPYPNLAVTPQELDWVLDILKQHFTCNSLSNCLELWESNKNITKPLLAITFDDGQLDNFENALKILTKHDLLATFYIPVQSINTSEILWHDKLAFSLQTAVESNTETKNIVIKLLNDYGLTTKITTKTAASVIERIKSFSHHQRLTFIHDIEKLISNNIPSWANLMSWDEISELAKLGHEIGSHSMTHPLLPQLTPDQQAWEATESKNQLENKLNVSINSFCYPNGDNNPETQQIIQLTGYQNAVTTQPGINTKNANQFSYKRFDINSCQLRNRHNKLSINRLFYNLSKY